MWIKNLKTFNPYEEIVESFSKDYADYRNYGHSNGPEDWALWVLLGIAILFIWKIFIG